MPSTPQVLSGSTNGRAIPVLASVTTLHTTGTGKDQTTIFISNPTSSSIVFTLYVNSIEVMKRTIPAQSGWVPVLEDCVFGGAATVIGGKGASSGMYAMGKNIEVS